MITNNTCVPGNYTSSCQPASHHAGLAAGLTTFFLLLFMIVAGIIVYKYRNEVRNMFQSGHRRSQKKKDYTEPPEAVSHQYTSLGREQSVSQTPIYENVTSRKTEYNRHSVNQSGLSRESEEDLYLQCDLPDDAIYNNDPACNLSILPDSHDEDVYIMPDSL